MSNKKVFTHNETRELMVAMYAQISRMFEGEAEVAVYGIARGGVPVAYGLVGVAAVVTVGPKIMIAERPEDADLLVDDIIDSGNTMELWTKQYDLPFMALLDRVGDDLGTETWFEFPWESVQRDTKKSHDDSIVGTIKNRIREKGAPFKANDNISEFISENELSMLQAELTTRCRSVLEGLVIDIDNDHNTQDTAARMAKMFLRQIYKGRYEPKPKITSFPNEKNLDEMFVTGPITVRSACSHHFVPIVGQCYIAVIPSEDMVIGLSKFNRIVEWIARRPQIQEEMTVQIADELEELMQPKGLAVIVDAEHLCMTWRGVEETPGQAKMTTNVVRGIFRNDPTARAELMATLNRQRG